MTKRYIGLRTPDGCQVAVLDDSNPDGGYLLPPRYDLRNHSPDGFSWGYAGSGPSQLSLALLADALGDDDLALRHYQQFKLKAIGRIEGDKFELTEDGIRRTVAAMEAEKGWGR